MVFFEEGGRAGVVRLPAVKPRTQAINQLKAVLITADPAVREPLAALPPRPSSAPAPAWPTHPVPVPPPLQPSTRSASSPAAFSNSARRPATSRNASPRPSPPAPRSCSRPSESVPTAPPPWSSPPATTPNGSAAKHHSPPSAASAPSRHPPANPPPPPQPRWRPAGQRRPARIVISRLRWDPRARDYLERRQAEGKPAAKPSAASNATPPARSTASSSQPSALTCPKPLDKHRGIFSPHLTTARDGRVGAWASANNVEIAYTPTNSSWLNRIEAQFTALRHFALDGTDHATHQEQASMIRRYIIWRNNHAYDERLRRIVARANVA